MLSLHQAIEIKESIIAYLKATFTFQDKKVHKAFYDFVNHPTDGMFKGPYVSLKLRFEKAGQHEIDDVPLQIKPTWLPYDHQVKSWHRLSTQDKNPEPTIITTGTGSGKTESFIYPILDYCYKNLHRAGIKVIVLYPMNALATDQAKRLAEIIYEDERLRGRVTAGLFIGEGKNTNKYPKDMGADHIIENRESILSSPPDIVLTNFKMLDYALMKSNYHDLWAFNLKDKELLRFLVLDELHTYDGAQGTDVANLIRRLKLKLDLPQNHLCPVGTSATIGSGTDAPQLLAEYASKIFGEVFSVDAIITENRVTPQNFFGEDEYLDNFLPRVQKLKETQLYNNEDFSTFIKRQIMIWQLDETDLAAGLRKQRIVKDLVTVCNYNKGINTLQQVAYGLSLINPVFKAIPQWDDVNSFQPNIALIESLFALIAEAKETDGRHSPFLYAQTQLWVREFSNIQRLFVQQPQFVWRDHVEAGVDIKALPPWFCRECGASGWIGVKHDNKERFEQDVNDAYDKFFSGHKNIWFINPAESLSIDDFKESAYDPTDSIKRFVYNRNLEFESEAGDGRIEVLATRKTNAKNKSEHICPYCNTKNTVSIIGTKIATLSSIAISQTLATDLDPQNEKNRKVLAFTNSVQDAAHQAGFVEARNYRFTLRGSIQKVINNIDKPVRLNELATAFINYWKTNADESGLHPLDAYYYRFYPKDYLGKSSPADYSENGKYDKHFIKEFDIRMLWEIYAEFGYDSLIGRTLEKTGSSGVYFNHEALVNVWQLMEAWLRDNEQQNTIKEPDFVNFLFLLLHRIRTRGAISNEFLYKFRTGDLKLWDLNWNKDTRHFLQKKFSPQSRLPKLITTERETKGGLLDSTFTQTSNWFHAYYRKSFPMAGNYTDIVNEFYRMLVGALLNCEVFDEKVAGDLKNYALNPAKIIVTNKMHLLECDKCGDILHSADDKGLGVGGHCLQYRCSGIYHAKNEQSINYYQSVYNRKRSPRIYAADHTGLLERKQRELLEVDFKSRPKFNSKNTMVATSTLEMGIDIGTLNAAFNNSIPPLPSNFLQRIGRAGRSSGSALIVNFAKSQAHDLFYYQEPMDMMAGEIATPGCYLEAKEILNRHFFAYCIDSWTLADQNNHIIPGKIGFIKIETQDVLSENFFLNRILNFTKANEDKLFTNFRKQYVNDVRNEVFVELKRTLDNEQFFISKRKIFEKLKAEIAFLNAKRKEIKNKIETLKLGNDDPLQKELNDEFKNLGGIISSIRKRNTLEYLTNCGALPNYAFPETGVVLSAKVLGSKAEGSNKPPINKDFEIVRSARQAITEFAPDNYFYTQGYRLQVTGINTFDWADTANFHSKRFCSQCDNIQIDGIAGSGNCPKCGHESWGAVSNVHKFAKLVTVKSFSNQPAATLNDKSEERDRVIYTSDIHFDFDQKTSLGAWALQEVPFGIEFVKSVRVCNTNLGLANAIDALKIKINEKETSARGFITCKHCGKSSSDTYAEKWHYGYCKHAEHAYAGHPDDVFEEVFFFREMITEALKIILPIQELNSEAEVKMFKAGVELGLKKYYKGNPQHIVASGYKEYNNKTLRFDRYLVLYDTVPGGTGYLEHLFDRKEFSGLLFSAYEAIRDCGCQHEGKDGCYRCIYSYSNQYHQSELSRKRAEKWFKDIVAKAEGWSLQTGGLSDVAGKGQIEESELEIRFIRSLKKFAGLTNPWTFSEVNEDGTVSYLLSYNSLAVNLSYHIRPQINLGPADGVEFYTRTDFLIICTEATLNGSEHRESIRKIAVYLDGYQYHASSGNNRFENDLKKRIAINASPEFTTWTLTWEDMERFDEIFVDAKEEKNRKDKLSELLDKNGFKQTQKLLIKSAQKEKRNVWDAQNNFERLVQKLEYPFRDEVSKLSWTLYLAFFQHNLFQPSFRQADLPYVFNGTLNHDTYCLSNKTLDGFVLFQGVELNDLFECKTLVNIERKDVLTRLLFKDTNNIAVKDWNLFWIYYNLVQLFEIIIVDDFSASGSESVLVIDAEAYNIDGIFKYFDNDYHSVLKELYKKGYIGSEDDEIGLNTVINQKKQVLAEAALIIPHLKVAFEPLSLKDEEEFYKLGFEVKPKSHIKEVSI